jgi:hypothetical protein
MRRLLRRHDSPYFLNRKLQRLKHNAPRPARAEMPPVVCNSVREKLRGEARENASPEMAEWSTREDFVTKHEIGRLNQALGARLLQG